MDWLERLFDIVNRKLDALLRLGEAIQAQQKIDHELLLSLVQGPPPTAFQVTEAAPNLSQGETMDPVKKTAQRFHASIDFQLLPDGTAVLTATTVPPGSALPPGVVASWAVNPDGTPPGGLQVIVDLVKDPTGLTANAKGVAAEIGAVPTISATLPGGAVITGSGNPIDVEATPTGFVVSEQ